MSPIIARAAGGCRRSRDGFTLIELLVVVAIIGLLASLLLPALCRAKQKAKQASEFNAGRQLMLAWQFYADEHNDEVLPGYTSLAEAFDDQGHPLGSPIRDRYPWRLAPYLANNFRSIYVNESRRFLEDAASRSHDEYVYRASLYPSLGYNSVFLGGDEQKFNPTLAAATFGAHWLITRGSQIRRPSGLLAFLSARSRPGDRPSGLGTFARDESGFFVVHPPYLKTRQWAPAFDTSQSPEKFGYVYPRWNRRAVAALTDGHVESLNAAQLQDMQRWSNGADRPDWTLQSLP